MINLPKTMRGVWLTGHGDMDKLEIRQDIPVPAPGPQDVLIRVAAASVNNTDINTRVAWYSKQDGASEDASWSGQAIGFPLIEKLGADSVDVVIDLVAGNQWPQYLKRNHLHIPKGKMMRIKKYLSTALKS